MTDPGAVELRDKPRNERVDHGFTARKAAAVPVNEVVEVPVGVQIAELFVKVRNDDADHRADEHLLQQDPESEPENHGHDLIRAPEEHVHLLISTCRDVDFLHDHSVNLLPFATFERNCKFRVKPVLRISWAFHLGNSDPLLPLRNKQKKNKEEEVDKRHEIDERQPPGERKVVQSAHRRENLRDGHGKTADERKKAPENSDRDVDRRENRVRQLVGELKVRAVVREPIQKGDCRNGDEERKEKGRRPDVEKFLASGVPSEVIHALQDAVDALKSRHKCPVKKQWGTF